MNKWQALQKFWESFGLPAYDVNTVPDSAVYPYLTYEAMESDFDEKIPRTASLWYRSKSWSDISQKASQISDAIGGGAGVVYDTGRLWVTKESPFAQRMGETGDDNVRRIVLQVAYEFQ